MKNNIEAVIFDLDGTVLDTLSSLWYSANDSLSREGLKPLKRERFRYYAGDGARTLVERYLRDTDIDESSSVAALNPHDPANLDYFVDSYLTSFDLYSDYEVVPYPGIPELVDELKARGMRLGVCSNKPHEQAVRVISKHFGDKIDAVLGQKDGIPRKPDPAPALMVAEELGVSPAETLYVGDTDVDIRTGIAAGMTTVGALWGFRDYEELKEAGADYILADPVGIPEIID